METHKKNDFFTAPEHTRPRTLPALSRLARFGRATVKATASWYYASAEPLYPAGRLRRAGAKAFFTAQSKVEQRWDGDPIVDVRRGLRARRALAVRLRRF